MSPGIIQLRKGSVRRAYIRGGLQPDQGPITWSEQRPCTRVTTFSRTSLFLERFWREFRISLKVPQISQQNLQS